MTVIIAEDMIMFQEVMTRASLDGGHKVLATTSNGGEAIERCKRLHPDALLLDIELEGSSGLEVIDALNALHLPIKTVVVSGHLDEYTVYWLERSTARGVVDKNTQAPAAIIEALAAAEQGRLSHSPSYRIAIWKRHHDPHAFDKLLTETEQIFLRFAALGASDEEIAQQLGTSVRTAQGHRGRVLRKLGVENTVKLISYARTRGFHRFPPYTNCRSDP